MNISELRKALSSEDSVEDNAFKLLREISYFVNNSGTEEYGRELVLRALEKRSCFNNCREVLDSLVRHVGLFPYLDQEQLAFKDYLAFEFHRPPSMDNKFVFHSAQAEIYYRLMDGDNVIVSAPTSFGKSRIIDAIIATKKYQNIAIVVPTIALIDETRRRLSLFSDHYKIVTQLSQAPSEKNIFVFTAERTIAYEHLPKINFFVIDEFYKIGAISEDQTRTIALNQAFYNLHKNGGQFYLLGPNIQNIPSGLEDKFRCFFYSTNFATVVSEVIPIFGWKDKFERLIHLVQDINEQTLIYCKSPKQANDIAKALVESNVCGYSSNLQDASNWVSEHFHPEWIFKVALENGVGIHHGKLPRSLAQFVVRAFNEENLKFLVCTSTLIEGVNTKAKNVIIFDDTIGRSKYDFFTFNNIKGRSGRMFHHFIGKVYIFHEAPTQQLPFVDFPIYTQGDSVPESLLIQLDEEDLRASSKDRLSNVLNQDLLPIPIIKQNSGIDPKSQIDLAEYLEGLDEKDAELLFWSELPSWDQLKFVCKLLWDYFLNNHGKSGVFSAEQLAFKINTLRQIPDIRSRIQNELKPGLYAAETPDDAVERVLDFDRMWAGFEFPRLLMALSHIQKFIFQKKFSTAGDYSFYAMKVESLFRNPVAVALEEYGLPIQISDKIGKVLDLSKDLDSALIAVKKVPTNSLKLDSFEASLLEDVKNFL